MSISEWKKIKWGWEGDPNLCNVCGPNDPNNCRGTICLPPPIFAKDGQVIALERAENGRLVKSVEGQKCEHSSLKGELA